MHRYLNRSDIYEIFCYAVMNAEYHRQWFIENEARGWNSTKVE